MICLILQKLAWIKQGKLDSSSFEVEHVRKQIEELQEQIDQRYTFSNNYYTPTHREGAILQSPCLSVHPSVHTFVTDISASTGRNDFIFDIWLWHGDLYRVSPFQVYCTSTSCLPRDLQFFMFAVMKTFVTDISASIGRNYFIFDMWLWLVPCLPFPGLLHIYFLFTARLTIFHVCRNENFHNRYLSFYWKKWFYIWYMALAWWLVPCLPFPGLLHIYFLFTVWFRIFHVCHNENFRNRYLGFYWKKWFYI